MSSLVFVFLAAGCAALSNLFFRKNFTLSTNVTTSGYLLVFYFFSFILSFVFYPNIWSTSINFTVVMIGGCVGFLNVALMVVTGHALQRGPAGLTFAFQNASAVFPGLILFLLFDSSFGFSCSYLQLIGMAFVVMGLFLGAKKESINGSTVYSTWLKYALICFIVQILALTLIQGRCILLESDKLEGFLAHFTFTEMDDIWFMPGQFGVAFLLQVLMFFKEKRQFQTSEIMCGSLGGLANFGSTGLLLLATKLALPFEKCILFPCFSVATIILCNIWANKLYKENFNLRANMMCSFGVFLGILR